MNVISQKKNNSLFYLENCKKNQKQTKKKQNKKPPKNKHIGKIPEFGLQLYIHYIYLWKWTGLFLYAERNGLKWVNRWTAIVCQSNLVWICYTYTQICFETSSFIKNNSILKRWSGFWMILTLWVWWTHLIRTKTLFCRFLFVFKLITVLWAVILF